MFSLSHLTRVVYVLGLSLALFLLLEPAFAPAQFGVSGGFRGTPPLPTFAIPLISGSGSGSGGFGGIRGFSGGGGSASGSFSTQIIYINPANFLPNGGRIIGPPPPTMTPLLNNLLFGNFLFSPFTSDTTGAPWATLLSFNLGGGIGIGGGVSGMMGMSGGMGGTGMGGMRGGMGGGMGGFAGKGMGGFNGRKPL